jgi:hypothetical protein
MAEAKSESCQREIEDGMATSKVNVMFHRWGKTSLDRTTQQDQTREDKTSQQDQTRKEKTHNKTRQDTHVTHTRHTQDTERPHKKKNKTQQEWSKKNNSLCGQKKPRPSFTASLFFFRLIHNLISLLPQTRFFIGCDWLIVVFFFFL